ncbi:MAG: WD40 repeat domain-containing serine/threonine protein kinase [Planctomycetaceae bacterium]
MEPQDHEAGGAAAGAAGGVLVQPDSDACLTGSDDSFGFGRAGSWSLSGELPPGANLGGFTILRLLAQGGMGRVYEARQEAPRRTVAVKVLREGALSSIASERLLREAETLASLRHPHIAQIHTCGTAPAAHGGVPFFVMELVEGARTITRFVAARAPSVRARVALFRKVCDAVAHGHRHGVVHRDLKPANILVDAAGEPKVIDYGIARGADGTGDAAGGERAMADGGACITRAGDVVGTLRYMSPEQVLEPGRGPDARSDVYALGLVLHELLVGRLPYDLAGMPLAEAARVLSSHAAPGTALVERAVLAEERRDDARALAVIVATCLEPSPADRYATAGEVAADLDRWLDGRAIVARPPTPLESLRRLARRHRIACIATTAFAATLVASVVAVSLLSWRLEGQRREARAAHGLAAREAASARSQLYASTVLLAAAARDRDNLPEAANLLAEARAVAGTDPASQPIELACLAASLDDSIATLPPSADTVTAVAWSPDGRRLVIGDRKGVVRIHTADSPTDAEVTTLAVHVGAVWSVAFSPDGRLLAEATGEGTVCVRDIASGTCLETLKVGQTVYAAAFSPDGQVVATGSRDRTVRLWDVESGRETRVLEGHEGTVYGVAFAPNGAIVATCSHDRTVRLWDAETGRQRAVLHGHDDRVFDVAVSPDGRVVASASEDGTVRLWDILGETETGCLHHPVRVNAIAFSADGTQIATAAADGILRIWDVGRGVEAMHLRGHRAAVWSLAWAAEGRRVATGAADGDIRLWDPARRLDVLPVGGRVLSAAHSPDGMTLAIGTDAAEVRLCDAATLVERGRLGSALGRVNGVAWSPDGGLVAGACDDGAVFVWDAASRERTVAVQPHTRRVYAVAFAPAGGLLATASEDRTVAFLDPRTGASAGPALAHPRRVFCVAFSPDGSRVATACEDRSVRFWDVLTGAELTRLSGHEGPVNWVTFSPDGRSLASAASDGTVRLWAAADGSLAGILGGPASQVWKVAFSPDGSRVAAAAADGTVHLWDASSGRSALTLAGHRDQVWAVAFAADGRSLVSGAWDGTARVWGIAPAEIVRRRAGDAR